MKSLKIGRDKGFFYLVAVLTLMLASTPLVRADVITIQIDDLTDIIAVTVNGSQPTLLPDSTPEFIHFTWPFSQPSFDASGSPSVSRDMLESIGGPVSDRLLITGGNGFVDIKFASDPAPLPPQGSIIFDPVLETGAFQVLAHASYQFSNINPDLNDRFDISARSDVGDTVLDPTSAAVPEPSSFILLGTGMIGMAGYVRRRRRLQRKMGSE